MMTWEDVLRRHVEVVGNARGYRYISLKQMVNYLTPCVSYLEIVCRKVFLRKDCVSRGKSYDNRIAYLGWDNWLTWPVSKINYMLKELKKACGSKEISEAEFDETMAAAVQLLEEAAANYPDIYEGIVESRSDQSLKRHLNNP